MAQKIDPRSLLIDAHHLLVNSGAWKKTAEERALMTIACKDAEGIPRVKNAGEIIQKDGMDVQVMHNGLLVKQGGYQGNWQAKIIKELKGVHEPQEEKVYHHILERLDEDAVIVELGSWWAYYSLWLLLEKKKSIAICGEPDPENLKLAKINANLNNIDPKRIHYYESAAGEDDNKIISFFTEDERSIKVPIRTVDSISKEQALKKIDILHLDIQGAELSALKGAVKSIKKGLVRFVFISTHHYAISEDPLIHQKCLTFIKENGGHIVAEHGILESCSGDGLIVASFDKQDKDFKVEVSHMNVSNSLFREYEEDIEFLSNTHNMLVNYIKKSEKNLNSHIEQLRAELQKKSDYLDQLTEDLNRKAEHIDRMEGLLNEITPLSRHIKRQVKVRLKKTKKD